jgi:hypothetical protein
MVVLEDHGWDCTETICHEQAGCREQEGLCLRLDNGNVCR